MLTQRWALRVRSAPATRNFSTRHTNPILKAMLRSTRTDPSVLRRPPQGRTRGEATCPRQGAILAADDPTAAAEWARRPRILPARGPQGRGLPLVAAGVGPPRPAA